MTLSMNQNIIVNSTPTIGNYAATNRTEAGADFNSLLQMLLSTTLNSMNNSESGSSMQNLLLSLAPYFQNLSTLTSGVKAPTGLPVHGALTQEYQAGHQGLDFGIEVGTNVKSTMSGVVKYAGWNDEGYGNLVIIDNGGYQTYYGHLSSIPVQVGDVINAGDVIGASGNTGNSTGPHLHYEIRSDGKPINPTSYAFGKMAEYRV